MKAQDFIQKHGLSLIQEHHPFQQGDYLMAEVLIEPGGLADTFEIYSNPERTIYVSVNATRRKFRVVHHELVSIYSEWTDIAVDQVLDPLPCGRVD